MARSPRSPRGLQPVRPFAHLVSSSLLTYPHGVSLPTHTVLRGVTPKIHHELESLFESLLQGDQTQDRMAKWERPQEVQDHTNHSPHVPVTGPHRGGEGCPGSDTWWGGCSPTPALIWLLALVPMVSFPTVQERSEAPEQFFSLECPKKKGKARQEQERISWKHFFGVL